MPSGISPSPTLCVETVGVEPTYFATLPATGGVRVSHSRPLVRRLSSPARPHQPPDLRPGRELTYLLGGHPNGTRGSNSLLRVGSPACHRQHLSRRWGRIRGRPVAYFIPETWHSALRGPCSPRWEHRRYGRLGGLPALPVGAAPGLVSLAGLRISGSAPLKRGPPPRSFGVFAVVPDETTITGSRVIEQQV